jgi:hypothetical protein
MRHLVESVRTALDGMNWYAALSVALALPDICAKVHDPSQRYSRARYVAWFDRYLANTYRRIVAGRPIEFLNGDDCYALRCAYLHEGEFDISTQRSRKILEAYEFVATPQGTTVHLNRSNTALQLQIDMFCEEICAGVEAWLVDVAGLRDVQARLAALPRIVMWGSGTPV